MRTAIQFLLFAVLLAVGASSVVGAEKAPKMLSHDVYFTLKNDNSEAKEALVAGCKKFLSKSPGVVWFAAGALVEEHEREVNDRDFDVALHMVFKDKESHDKYQDADSHHKFIEEFEENWQSVRVFDSWLTATAHAEGETHGEALQAHGEDERHATHEAHTRSGHDLKLPEGAAHFAGMIGGKVVAKTDRGVRLHVEKILKTWHTSKAKDAGALVGKDVHVVAKSSNDGYAQRVGKFLRGLEEGESVELDVACGEGGVLVILELTEKQRRRVAD